MESIRHFFAPVLPGHPAELYGKWAFGLIFMLAILGLLQAAPRRSRKFIIAAFTFAGGLYYVLEFFLPAPGTPPQNFLTPYQDFVANLSTVIGTFGVGIGVISLMQLHLRSVARQRPGWGNSVALIAAFVLMTLFGILNAYYPASHPFHWRNSTIHHFFLTAASSISARRHFR